MGNVGLPVEVNRPPVARKTIGSTREATCFTSHDPTLVAEKRFTSVEYTAATLPILGDRVRGGRPATLGPVTPYALFGVAMTSPLAVWALAAALVRRRAARRVGRLLRLAAVGAATFLVVSALLLAGWAQPDALDELPPERRAALEPAVRASPQCGLVPFARVAEVEVIESPTGDRVLRFRCGLTPWAVPRLTGEATCADGRWQVPGLRETASAGRC